MLVLLKYMSREFITNFTPINVLDGLWAVIILLNLTGVLNMVCLLVITIPKIVRKIDIL